MRIGMTYGFQNTSDDVSDRETYQRGLELLVQAEDLGFELIWCTEHHFNQRYAMTPDNFMILTHLAAKMPSITVGTGAVILPWNNPLRVAERVLLLDNMTNGRVIFGIGRGLAKREYAGFMTDMNTSRDRYDEAAKMILSAIETGVIQGDGPYYPQDPIELHPAPFRSFKDRFYAVGMSPTSVVAAADIGAGLMLFVQEQPEATLPALEAYRARYQSVHGVLPPLPPVLGGQFYCHEDGDIARDRAHEYIGRHYIDIINHYNMNEDHFGNTKGYDAYAETAKKLQEIGNDKAALAYSDAQLYGTPDQILEKIQRMWDVLGPFEAQLNPGPMGGMPFEMMEESVRLVSREVLPELKKLK